MPSSPSQASTSRDHPWSVDWPADSDLRILTLLLGEGDRRVLEEWLRDRFEVVSTDEPGAVLRDGAVDLCIVDPQSFSRYASALVEYKDEQAPEHVPFLLVRPRDEPIEDPRAREYIDDAVTVPVDQQTLSWRIESLLRLRTLSVGLARSRRQLEVLAQAAAHDLRNPLNIAKASVDGVDDGAEIERIARSLGRMEHLVDDLLTVVRTAEPIGPDEYEWLDLEAIATAGRTLTDLPADRLHLEDVAGLRLKGKPLLVEQLFDNLLRNAVQHGGDDVTVTVGVLASVEGFYVEDDGPGVPADVREDVFESGFSTGGGSGLGLQVVERVCTAHGWTIDLTEGEAGGARFEVGGVELER